jgi:DNA-binding MarR family transcriptional regulator
MSYLTDTTGLLPAARALVIKNQRGSISLVQRHLKIGYNAAAELLEMLERDGVVGPINGAGGRPVLVARLTPADEKIIAELMESGTTGTDGSQTPNDAAAIPRAKAGRTALSDDTRAYIASLVAERDELAASRRALAEALQEALEYIPPRARPVLRRKAIEALDGAKEAS